MTTLATTLAILTAVLPLRSFATANFVYHERSSTDVHQGAANTCVGAVPYVTILTPTAAQAHELRFKVEYQFFTDTLRVYYTTDGSNPSGAFGTPAGTTVVVSGAYECTFTFAGNTIDVAKATIPAQPAGTVVKYIVSAWHSGGGPEIFANSGTCGTCTPADDSSEATVFQYTVASLGIATEPVGATVECGGTATFTVVASGTAPFDYQWRHAGTNLPGATNSTLMISPVSFAHAGNYDVIVTNIAGTTNSAVVVLTVQDTIAPVITCPTNLTACTSSNSAPVTFTTTATDACDTTPTLICTPASGSEFPLGTNTVTCVASDDSANTNMCSFSVAVLSMTTATGPTNLVLCPGATATFCVTAAGTEPFTYQWYKGTSPIANATNNCLMLPNISAASADQYCVNVTGACNSVSNCATLTVLTNTTATALASIASACTGSMASFSTVASGTGPFSYRWTKDGVELMGETGPSLSFTVATGSGGNYCVEVTGLCSSVTNCATLGVAVAPVITAQPANQTTPMGNGVVFSVTATGQSTPVSLAFQWQSNGVAVAGATGSSLAVSNVALVNNGDGYRVIVSNCAGSITSQVALLTVTPIVGMSFDFNTPGQFTNAPYNLVGNDWQLGGSGTFGAINGVQPFGPVVPFEVSTGGVGVATGGGGLDLAFNTGLDQSYILSAVSYDFSQPNAVLRASIMTKIKVPTAGARAIQLGFITATNGDDTLGNRLQLAGVNATANMAFMSAILQSTVLNVTNPSYQLRAQWKPTAGTATTEATALNSPTNTLQTNRWYKFTAVYSNTTVIYGSNSMTISSSLQDMGNDGITPGAVVLAMAPQLTNVVNMTSNRWFFAIRCAAETGGQDYWDNVNVSTRTGPLQLVVPLGNRTVAQGGNASFQAMVDGDGPYAFQWYKNGAPIAGAGNWKYRTPALKFPDDNGAQISVTVTGPGVGNTLSSTGVVTVTAADLALLSVGSVEGSVIGVRFSQPVDVATATVGANYLVNGTPAIAAQLAVNDGLQQYRTNEVLITPMAPISGVFTVAVVNVKSHSLTTLGAQNSAVGEVLGLTGQDIDPASIGQNLEVQTLPGWEYSFAPGQLTVNAGGHDLYELWDGFRFTYKQVTGDFDLKVRVAYQDSVRPTNRAGFDARLSLDPASPHVGAYAMPSAPGRNYLEGGARALYNQPTVTWGNQRALFYPDVWLRFRRVGNTFIRYASTNGVNWNCDGLVQSTGAGALVPDTLYVGLANNCGVGNANGSSATAQQLKLSQLDNYGDFAGYAAAVITNISGPSNITVSAGNAATFTNIATFSTNGVLYAAAGELAYVWQRTNTAAGGWTNMPTAGQTNGVLNTGALYAPDSGAMFRVILAAPGALSVTSEVAVVTVTDTTGPTVTSSLAAPLGPNQLVLNFSEFLDPATALDAANYLVTNGFGVQVAVTGVSFMNNDPRVVVLTVASPLPGGTNFVRVTGVRDLGNQVIGSTLVAVVQSGAPTSASGPQLLGPVVVEFYPHMPNFGGIGDVVNRSNYRRNLPGGVEVLPTGSPDFIMYSNVFGIHPGAFPNAGWGENYGARIYSYFRPTATAAYKFYTRLDDFGEFWINTNAVNSVLPPDVVIGFTTNSPVLQQAWMCMDGIKTNYGNSKYLNFDAAGVNSGFYVFAAAGNTVVDGMRFWAAGDAPERDPLTFQLSGTTSLNTNGPWTVIASGNTGLPNTGGAGTGRYLPGPDATFANTTAYRGYRVVFPSIRGAGQNSMQIGEVEFLNGTTKVLPSGAFLAVQTSANNGTYNVTQSSSNMTLNAGQLYYMELRYKETGGGDGGTVAVRTDTTVPAVTEVISNQFLVFPTNLAPVSTPVQIEIYSALATVNPQTGNGGWNASGNGSILDLLNALTRTNYIAKIPNIVGYGQHFGFNTNKLSGAVTMDNYLGRIYANFVAPSNGLYKFYVAVDDTAQLLMNTNAVDSTDPAGAKLLGQIINYSGTANQNIGSFRQVQGNSGVYNLLAENVSLVGGQRYYIEGRWREGGGGDGIQVAVRSQGDTTVPPGAANTGASVIPASQLELSSSFQRWGPIKLGGIMASVNGGPGVVTNQLVLNEGDVVTYNAVDVSGAGSYQGSVANASVSTTAATTPTTFAGHQLSTLGLVWLKNGTDLARNQLFSSQMYYVSQPVTVADNGTLSLLVSNTFSTATQTVSIVVNPDSTPPIISFANSSPYGDTVTLLFNEPVEPLSSQCLANYRIAGLQIFWVKRDEVNRRRVVLGTSPQTPNTCYTVIANGVRDIAGNPTVNAMATFTAWGSGGSGAVYVELYTNVAFGAIDQFLQTNPKFLYNMPDVTYYTNNFGVGLLGADSGLNFYGARISGLFMPPSNGLYRFFVRGDDATQLYMNTNGPAPAGRSLIARNDGAGSGAYNNGNGLGGDNTRIGASASPILSLTNGTPYWVEAILMEGTGGDYMQVVMSAIDPGSLTEIGGVPAVAVGAAVSGGFFTAPGNPDLNKLFILSGPPANQSLAENDLVNLTVVPSIVPPALAAFASFQWQRSNGSGGFTNVPGGNTPALANYYAKLADDNATFRFLASIPGTNAVVSTTLHVTQDVTPPFIVSASSLNGTNIDVCFNEPLEFNSADDDFNYTVNSGAKIILSVIVRPDGRSVTITLDSSLGGPGSEFTVQADNIIDLAEMALSGSSVTNGVVQGLVPLTIGAAGVIGVGGYNPAPGDSSFSCMPGSVDVSANGWDIWNAADGYHFTSRQVSGNFDIKTRVQRLVGADQWSKAGLMARGSLASSSRFMMMGATPPTTPIVGQAPNNFFAFQHRDADGASAAPALNNVNSPPPVGYPNSWVRLQRVGSVFNGYYGSNGVDWVLLLSRDSAANSGGAFPDTLEVGLATVSHDQTRGLANNAFAEYRDFYFPAAPVITQQPGPSLVVTGIHKNVTFSGVVVTGQGPITYQWRKDGMAIPGANSPSLSFADTRVIDTGIYTLLAANDGGGVISSNCQLIVTNALPVAGTDMFTTTQNMSLSFSVGSLLGNDFDPEGDPTNLVAVSGVSPVTYSANFDDGLLPPNSSVTGVAGGGVVSPTGGVNDSGYLKLNDSVGSAAGAMVINELTPGRRVSAFSASFMLRIGDGSAQPADGFNFSFASDLPNTASTAFGENGAGTGFSFVVDNYQFVPLNIGAAANNPGGGTAFTSGMKLQYNNIILTGVQMPTWNSPRFVPVTIDVTAQGVATVTVDGTNVFGNFTLPGYTARRGRFGLYGRTGGQSQTHWVDNLSITLNTLDTSRDIPPPNLGGATLHGNAYVEGTTGVGGSGALHLTDAANNQFGAYILPELTPGQGVASFTASFSLRIGNGSGNAADGFSFNLAGDLPNPPAYAAYEEGAGTGLSLCIDNYPTGGADSPSFKLKLGGVQLGLVLIPKWNNTAYIPVNITLTSAGQLTVNVNGTNVVANLAIPYAPITGRFGLFARTGGENQTHWIDNLVINATAVNSSVGAYNANFNSGTYGTVTLTNGIVTYTPPSDLCGPDAFYYIVSDGQAGGATIGRVDVLITEQTPAPPVIVSCPTNRPLPLAAGQCQLALPDLTTSLVATDNCCCVTITQSPAPGTMLNIGMQAVTFTVTDTLGLTATCMATVTVTDVTPPSLLCSTNITADCSGPAGATVNYTVIASDECAMPLLNGCTPASGTLFPMGTTTVNCTADDGAGNTTTCSFTVTVADRTAPVLTCPAGIVINLPLGQCTATVNYAAPTYVDNCDPNVAIICVPPSGSVFPIGTNVVSCMGTDAGNNTGACAFQVTVLDLAKPTIVCPSDATVECPNPTAPPATGVATATDNCDMNVAVTYQDGSATEVTSGNMSGWTLSAIGDPLTASAALVNGPSPAPIGTGSLRLAIGSNGEGTAQGRNTLYHDTRLSALTALNFRARVTASSGSGESIYLLLNVDSDNNGVPDDIIGFEPEYQSGYTTQVPNQGPVANGTWQSWDALIGGWWSLNHPGIMSEGPGVRSLGTYIAAFPNARIVNSGSGAGGVRLVSGGGLGTWENFDGNVDRFAIGVNGSTALYDFDQTAGNSPELISRIVRTWTGVDDNGNVNSCSQLVDLYDTVAPTISCSSNIVMECTNPNGQTINYSVSASDACSPVTPTCAPPSGTLFPSGVTTVHCVASDATGHTNSCSFTVSILDTQAPVFCNVPAVTQSAGTVDNFTGPEPASPSDDLVDHLLGLDLRGFDELGSDLWFAHTFDNLPVDIASAVLRVKVRASLGDPQNDTIQLLFSTPGGGLLPANWVRRIGSPINDPTLGLLATPWAVGEETELVLDLSHLPNANGSFTDLTATLRAQRYVDLVIQDDTLVDSVSLEVRSCNCQGNVTVNVNPVTCGAIVNFPTPAFTDVCDTTPTVVCQPASGTLFPVGATTVFCTATDDSGNRGRCGFTVTVVEPAPSLSISRQGNSIVVRWPVGCTTFRLEQTSLLVPTMWSTVLAPISIVGGNYQVVLPNVGTQLFFRLAAP